MQVQGGRSPRGQDNQPVLVLTDAHSEALTKGKLTVFINRVNGGKCVSYCFHHPVFSAHLGFTHIFKAPLKCTFSPIHLQPRIASPPPCSGNTCWSLRSLSKSLPRKPFLLPWPAGPLTICCHSTLQFWVILIRIALLIIPRLSPPNALLPPRG